MLEHAALHNPTLTLDDLRRDVRLGMGPCQGGFCTYRAAGILHEIGGSEEIKEIGGSGDRSLATATWEVASMQSPAANLTISSISQSPQSPQSPNLLLRDFLQERWKGLTPILWGQQLKQERLDELIYLSLLNVDHLPDQAETSPLTGFYHYDTSLP
jgi:glycerol-3-phosphate dehydrogenase